MAPFTWPGVTQHQVMLKLLKRVVFLHNNWTSEPIYLLTPSKFTKFVSENEKNTPGWMKTCIQYRSCWNVRITALLTSAPSVLDSELNTFQTELKTPEHFQRHHPYFQTCRPKREANMSMCYCWRENMRSESGSWQSFRKLIASMDARSTSERERLWFRQSKLSLFSIHCGFDYIMCHIMSPIKILHPTHRVQYLLSNQIFCLADHQKLRNALIPLWFWNN